MAAPRLSTTAARTGKWFALPLGIAMLGEEPIFSKSWLVVERQPGLQLLGGLEKQCSLLVRLYNHNTPT